MLSHSSPGLGTQKHRTLADSVFKHKRPNLVGRAKKGIWKWSGPFRIKAEDKNEREGDVWLNTSISARDVIKCEGTGEWRLSQNKI